MNNTKKTGLIPPKSAKDILDMYYFEARSHLLETAAILDRIERSEHGCEVMEDKRIQNLFKICEMITHETSNRSEQFLKMLSVS
jgi:hypothetical protein